MCLGDAMATPSMPARELAWGERFKLRASTIVWFVLALAFLLGLPVLLEVHVLLVLAVAALALLLAFPGAWLVRRIFSGQRRQRWAWSYLKAFLGLVLRSRRSSPPRFTTLFCALT